MQWHLRQRLSGWYALGVLALAQIVAVPSVSQATDTSFQRGAACDGSEGVYLYEQVQFGGRCVRYTDDIEDLSVDGFNNVASSIRFVGNWTAALYVDQRFGGTATVFSRDDADLGNNSIRNRRASSIRIDRGRDRNIEGICTGDGVYLYEHPNFEGRCVKLTSDANDLRTLDFDDTASSVRVRGNWTTTLARDLNGTGVASTFTGDDANLIDDAVGDNQVTSVRVVQRGNAPQVGSCDGAEGVYLYEHANFQGRCLKFLTDVGDLRTLGFDDLASSIHVVGNWTATLARDLNGTGVTGVYTTLDDNLADDAVGDNQVTSILVRRR